MVSVGQKIWVKRSHLDVGQCTSIIKEQLCRILLEFEFLCHNNYRTVMPWRFEFVPEIVMILLLGDHSCFSIMLGCTSQDLLHECVRVIYKVEKFETLLMVINFILGVDESGLYVAFFTDNRFTR